MSFLTPCEACNRHLESTETHCPFCGAAVSAAMRARRPTLPNKRLGRAALMAFGATVVGAAPGCGGSDDATDSSSGMTTQTTEPTGNPGPGPSPSGSSTANTPPSQNTSPRPTSVATMDPPMAVAAYGVPILPPQPLPTNQGAGGQAPEMPINPSAGAGGMNEPEPMVEPEPFAMAAYGVFPLEPIDPPVGGAGSGGAEAVGGAGGNKPTDAGAPDAGEAEPEPVVEPEPMAVPAYGVFPLPSE